MIKHSVKVVATSLVGLVQEVASLSASGFKLDTTKRINTVSYPYSANFTVEKESLMERKLLNVMPFRSKELNEYLDKADLEELRSVAYTYGCEKDATRADIKKRIRTIAVPE